MKILQKLLIVVLILSLTSCYSNYTITPSEFVPKEHKTQLKKIVLKNNQEIDLSGVKQNEITINENDIELQSKKINKNEIKNYEIEKFSIGNTLLLTGGIIVGIGVLYYGYIFLNIDKIK